MGTRSQNLLRPSAYRPADNIRGSILILALWSLCLLTVFAVMMGYGVRQKLTFVDRVEYRDKARMIAEAGLYKAASELINEPEKVYYWLGDRLNNDPAAFKGIDLGGGTLDICYNYIDERTKENTINYGIIDEERKININKADREVIERLFRIVLGNDGAEAQELAASIVDWRDTDNDLSIPLGSAESSYYRNLHYPYDVKNGDFEVLDELLLVKGMTADILEKMRSYITIYGNGRVNANTASRQVLISLGLSEKIADGMMAFRAGRDETKAVSEDNFFGMTFDIVPKISQFINLNPGEIAQLTAISERYLAVNSYNFMVQSVVRSKNKKISEGLGVVNIKGKVLYWRESV